MCSWRRRKDARKRREITCAQSFHWFDPDQARSECKRILKPGGKAILLWNSRLTEGSPFREGYEALLQTYGTDYLETKHTNISEKSLRSFFQDQQMSAARFANRQLFDFEGLAGRLLSSSYVPTADHPNFEPMMRALRELFDRTQQDGIVHFDYVTEVFWGEI
jgi:SAM-dependent methyltransferase